MNGYEDTECEKYFTPPDKMTLTEMLKEHRLVANERTIVIDAAKEVFKKWLKEIPLGTTLDNDRIAIVTRHDLIVMVDEP